MTGLICAVPFEAKLLLKAMAERRHNPPFTRGRICKTDVAHISSGIGTANAARAAAMMCERLDPDLLLFFGIGGAYPHSGLKKGDVAAAESDIYGDCGMMTPEGFRDMGAIGFPLLKKGKKEFFNEFPACRISMRKLRKHFPDMRTGKFVTVCASSRTPERAAMLENLWDGIVENMEGAAAAQTALYYGVPFFEIRGISNIAGEPPENWDKELGAENCQKMILRLLEVL
jgi:futalosine hydrolase